MTADQPSLLRRPHTILGVCEAIGEDFGFNPLYLRIAFAAGLFFATMWVIASYFALGLVVALSRWVAPVPVSTPAAVAEIERHDEEEEQLKIAA